MFEPSGLGGVAGNGIGASAGASGISSSGEEHASEGCAAGVLSLLEDSDDSEVESRESGVSARCLMADFELGDIVSLLYLTWRGMVL